ncbi:MAG TPA: 50S ribosomal protein L20 [Elusimicrobiota bacterium]|jgi:large subunit ribosomal protein L20|nr:50S ribosomal protein L20 [Elusimicrobiota bacterium]HMU95952.1 50S ribosomal protein L20 [Elusimicrobiota bacterium]HMX93959.1 50S ribosomal protein L20 [Elusimicrobiota bacterium]HMZ25835.1 50S ribosomal protein L20 [Elusimicrobiota bacterium]HNA60115.1 50S ribosomal protein L20 [Elusimicrobiota bacterium]
MRVKSVVYTRQRKKKWFRRAKGAYATKKSRWRMVLQHLEMSMRHMYRGRKQKKGDLRAVWIQRINAAARQEGLSYSRFLSGLKKAGVVLDRKMLANLASADPASFKQLANVARENLSVKAA